MEKKVRVGIMGGTFNPIHIGHVIAGECAYEQFGLEEVLFMPSKTPPHKSMVRIASAENRANMVKLAIEDNPHFSLSSMELERSGVTYTVDTLRQLHENNENREYYFIIGADSLFDFEKWKDPHEILRMAVILVASRDGTSNESLKKQIAFLEHAYGGSFGIIEIPTIGISSSEIRARRQNGQSIRYYVDRKVSLYMEKHGLYR